MFVLGKNVRIRPAYNLLQDKKHLQKYSAEDDSDFDDFPDFDGDEEVSKSRNVVSYDLERDTEEEFCIGEADEEDEDDEEDDEEDEEQDEEEDEEQDEEDEEQDEEEEEVKPVKRRRQVTVDLSESDSEDEGRSRVVRRKFSRIIQDDEEVASPVIHTSNLQFDDEE
jgi:hypothetical protein